MGAELAKIVKLNETMVSLLGRIAFKKQDVREIVTRKNRNPEKCADGYNACDGNHAVAHIAAIVRVKEPTIVPIVQQWEEPGIIFDIDKPGGRTYKKIFPI